MDKSEKLRKIILTKYKSLKEFANEVNIPSTTLISALDRGIGGMGIDRVIRICDTLKIDIKTFEPIKKTYNPYKLELNKEEYELILLLRTLNIKGINKVLDYTSDLLETNKYKKESRLIPWFFN
mgnify:CR=1 FL=1